MTLETESISALREATESLEMSFKNLPGFEPAFDFNGVRSVLSEVAVKMRNNYPYPHPLYIGHMMKPPHPVARMAYALSLWINPNNHALDGGRASSAMEKEAVAELARMFGWQTHLGHLTSGGTVANLEALWVSKCEHPDKKIVASEQAHFTHNRICAVLGIPFKSVPCDKTAHMDANALEKILKNDDIGTVVVTMGTTATGSVDPLADIITLQNRFGFRIHADAAYGGYFNLVDNLRPDTRTAFDLLPAVDSIVVDPHKHGLQPYGCGCVIFKDPACSRFYKHDSAYTYLTSSELHLGEISLECSRPGASAVALWATMRMLPLVRGGEFAANLAKSRTAALKLFDLLNNDPRFAIGFAPELDIVVWAPRAESASEVSRLSEELFQKAAMVNLHMAKANLPRDILAHYWPGLEWDLEHVTCLRACLMKPEHLDWMDRIWAVLNQAMNDVTIAR
jgi:tyrosine decarboxylase / aspartate 1-decarboxylase